jgi:glycine oxidase
LIGPCELDGLLMASGHYRNGILLVPVTADAIAGMLTGGPVPELIAPFLPGRFALPAAGVPAAQATEPAARSDRPAAGSAHRAEGGAP